MRDDKFIVKNHNLNIHAIVQTRLRIIFRLFNESAVNSGRQKFQIKSTKAYLYDLCVLSGRMGGGYRNCIDPDLY